MLFFFLDRLTITIKSVNELQKNGFACIRFDFNGHGESDGEQYNMTVVNEIEDANGIILPLLTKIG